MYLVAWKGLSIYRHNQQKIVSLTKNISSPKAFIYTINAGPIDKDHWINDPEIGGGRIVGEVCHFIDLLRYLANSKIIKHSTIKMQNANPALSDNLFINLLSHNQKKRSKKLLTTFHKLLTSMDSGASL